MAQSSMAEEKERSPSAHFEDDYSTPEPPCDDAVYNVASWAKQHEASFAPPICNKLMFNNQLKVMFVGGPNTRKDFHIDCGEEFFFQMKGNIELPIYERGARQVMQIKEGHVFLLPGRIPHSPQRPEEGSLGLVVERTRDHARGEYDALRYYYGDGADEVLWEKWFLCNDLGSELKPIVEEFMASEECRSGQPSETSVEKEPPVQLDTESRVTRPFLLADWIAQRKEQLCREKCVDLFTSEQTRVRILTGPLLSATRFDQETWIYVLQGSARVSFEKRYNKKSQRDAPVVDLGTEDCLLVAPKQQYELRIPDSEALVMTVTMVPSAKNPFA